MEKIGKNFMREMFAGICAAFAFLIGLPYLAAKKAWKEEKNAYQKNKTS